MIRKSLPAGKRVRVSIMIDHRHLSRLDKMVSKHDGINRSDALNIQLWKACLNGPTLAEKLSLLDQIDVLSEMCKSFAEKHL